jgi:hypothetical protein
MPQFLGTPPAGVKNLLPEFVPCNGTARRGTSQRPMSEPPPDRPQAPPETGPRSPRARAVPSTLPFRVAVFYAAVHYLGLIALATALVCVLLRPSLLAAQLVVAGVVFGFVSWLIAYFKRRAVRCPLCKGTPLVNSGALPHVRARRIRPFNHGVSAVLSILVTQRFRCMYCGSDYDLLKPRQRLAQGAEAPVDEASGNA